MSSDKETYENSTCKLTADQFHGTETQWDAYISLLGLDKESQANKVKALALCFSCMMLTIVDNLGLTAEQSGKVTIMQAIQ